jgi:hypothetical protein
MSEPNPPRRPLATFLRPHAGSHADTDATPSAPPASASPDIEDSPADAAPEPVAEPVAITGEAPSQVEATMSEPVRAAASGSPLAQAEPVFLRGGGHRLRTPRWQWAIVAALSLLLLLQIALADRARLAAEASTRPWIAGLCSVLRCDLPAWREPAAFSMISRDVRPVPQQAGALQVQASIRNDAQWAQDWPVLRLSLSDADGRVIGSGVFDASDYLGTGAETAGLLEPGQSAQISFRVREPAASTVAFNFEFL